MKSLQEAYNSIYSQEIQEDIVEQEVNIYEEAYQCLLEEGYEDNDAIEIVNYLYENNSLDGMLYESKAKLAKGVIDMVRMLGGMSGVWKPSAAAMRKAPGIQGAISRAIQGSGSKVKDAVVKGPKTGLPIPAKRKATGAAADIWNYPAKKRPPQLGLPKEGPSSSLPNRILPPAKPIPTPKETGSLLGVRNIPNMKQVSAKYGLDAPAPKPAWGGKPGNPWDTSDTRLVRLPKLPQAKPETVKKVQAALPQSPKRLALPGGTSPGSGRKDFVSSGGVSSKGGKMGPDGVKGTKLPGYTDASKQTVDVGATRVSSRRTKTDRAQEVARTLGKNKAAAAIALTTAGLGYGLTNATLSGNKQTVDTTDYETKVRKNPKYYADLDPDVKKSQPAKPAPAKPAPAKPAPAKPAPAPAPAKPAPAKPAPAPAKPAPAKPAPAKPAPAPAKPTSKTEPKVTTAAIKKKMGKIDKDVEELMQMRASTLERQGRSKEAEELRGKIKAKYGDYER